MRESGILMHITSLPGPYGVGTMGKQAFAFVDFLEAAGQAEHQRKSQGHGQQSAKPGKE